MKLNKTQIANVAYSVVCLLAALTTVPIGVLNPLIPDKYRAAALSIIALAGLAKSHWNFFITPEGKPLDSAPKA